MLLTSVPAKTVRDRTPLALWVALGLSVFSILMVAAARWLAEDLDTLLDDLPEAFTGLIGGSTGNYVVSEVFGLLAPIVVLVLAISGGVNAIAREEESHTADLLLTLPVRRRWVLVSKAAVIVLDLALVCVAFAATTSAAAALFDVDGFGPGDAVAATVHLFFLGLAFGMITVALGAVSGSASVTLGTASALAVASNLVAGLFPLVDGLEPFAELSPWYYFNGSHPVTDGVNVAHLGVLTAVAVVALGVGVVAVDRRDIGGHVGSSGMSLPSFGGIGTHRVSSVFYKSLTDRTTLIVVAGLGAAAMSVGISAMYEGISDALSDLSESFPDSFERLLGTADMGTPEGWIQGELLSITMPLILIAVAVAMAVAAVAGSDARHTLGLLVATPVSRRRIVLESAAAMVAAVVIVGVVSWLGLVVGSELAGLGISTTKLAASMTHLTLLAVFFGALALAIGSGASNTVAVRASVIAVLLAYLGDWILNINSGTAAFSRLSPWYYVAEARPLTDGVNVAHLGVLAAASAAAVWVAVTLFDRREIST